jgi:hypothetical protein
LTDGTASPFPDAFSQLSVGFAQLNANPLLHPPRHADDPWLVWYQLALSIAGDIT